MSGVESSTNTPMIAERMVTLERAKAVALADREQGEALLDSLAAAWGDSFVAATLDVATGVLSYQIDVNGLSGTDGQINIGFFNGNHDHAITHRVTLYNAAGETYQEASDALAEADSVLAVFPTVQEQVGDDDGAIQALVDERTAARAARAALEAEVETARLRAEADRTAEARVKAEAEAGPSP